MALSPQEKRSREQYRRLIALGTPPEECGTEMPIAPARGTVRPFASLVIVVDSKGDARAIDEGWHGRRPARVRDAVDRLRGRLSPSQLHTARQYAGLAESVSAFGVTTVNFEGTGGSGRRDDYSERRASMSRDLEAMRRRRDTVPIALEIQRLKPNTRGRRAVTTARLVDEICLAGRSPSHVLKAHGWSVRGETVKDLVRALGDALDRMGRTTPERGQRGQVWHGARNDENKAQGAS